MAEEPEKSGQEPNLELPSLLGFGRKKKRAEERRQADPVSDPSAARPDEPRGGLTPAAEKPKRLPPVPPPRAAEQTTVLPVVPPTEQPAATPVAEPSRPPRHEPRVDFTAPTYTAPTHAEQPTAAGGLGETAEGSLIVTEEPTPRRKAPSVSLPVINPRISSFLTGAFVGLLGVLLAFLAGRGCEAVRGVGSCGGIGLFALLVIVAIQVVVGAAVLSAWRVHDPVSTSFLGVGLVAAFVLLFLLGSLESVWMLLVVPVLSGLAYVLSWWVTTALVDDPSSDTVHR